ncbi:MAG: glycosyltransferase family 2 protein [Terriglobales bacterium]
MNSPRVDAPEISIVVPCFNEESVLAETHRRLTSAMMEAGRTFELVYVDDGSRDRTPAMLAELQRSDPRVRVVVLSRNFGHQIAITAGLNYSRGQAVVLIDADLQDPPEVILELIARWREGYEVVYGTRTRRVGETAFKTKTAEWFYRLINRISEIPIPLDTGDFRLLDRKAVDALGAMPERDRFVRGMVSWVGFRQIAVPYDRAARHAGVSKYSLFRMVKFAVDGILSFSIVPLRLATFLGLAASVSALIGAMVVAVLALAQKLHPAGWMAVLLAGLFIGGVQLICLGIVGEYLGRIYGESKRRPLYLVRETCGFDDAITDPSTSFAEQVRQS